MTRRAIVTGGAGFVGSHLVDLLVRSDYSVTVIDNFCSGVYENLEISFGSIQIANRDIEDDLEDLFVGVDLVFHLAGMADIVPSISNPQDYFKTNVQGTINVLEHSRKAGVSRFVYAASASCYGLLEEVPFTESSVCNPEYPYALTKFLGEQCVLHWSKVYALPTVSLRLFNVFGERSRSNSNYGAVLGVFLAQAANDYPLTIIGDGSQARDFVHVTDVAKAFLLAATTNINAEVINIGGGRPISVQYLASLISDKQVYIPKRPGEPEITWASIEKAKTILDWSPTVVFENSISELVLKKEMWLGAPLWTPEKIKAQSTEWNRYLGRINA